jgi:hypothetical protein
VHSTGFGDDIEVLTTENLCPDVRPHPLDPALGILRKVHCGDDVIGPHQ